MEINLTGGELKECEILLEIDYSRDNIPLEMNELKLRLFRFNKDINDLQVIPKQEVDTTKKLLEHG